MCLKPFSMPLVFPGCVPKASVQLVFVYSLDWNIFLPGVMVGDHGPVTIWDFVNCSILYISSVSNSSFIHSFIFSPS